jgi:hypothetical protein
VVGADDDVLEPVHVALVGLGVRKIVDEDGTRPQTARGPDVAVQLIGLGHVENLLTSHAVEGQALRVGEVARDRGLLGLSAGSGSQLGDGPLVG